MDGLTAFGAESKDYELKTTPQLHYLVRCLNTVGTHQPYGVPTEEGYYEKLATAFKQLMQGKKKPSRLTVDCANGIGAPKLAELLKYLDDDDLEIRIVNSDIENPKKLNYQVFLSQYVANIVWSGLCEDTAEVPSWFCARAIGTLV